MTAILKYLLAQMVFLLEGNRFRFVDSQTSSSFGGDALSSSNRRLFASGSSMIAGSCSLIFSLSSEVVSALVLNRRRSHAPYKRAS